MSNKKSANTKKSATTKKSASRNTNNGLLASKYSYVDYVNDIDLWGNNQTTTKKETVKNKGPYTKQNRYTKFINNYKREENVKDESSWGKMENTSGTQR